MFDFDTKSNKCTVCGHEYESVKTIAMKGFLLRICDECLEVAKHNFIWICMNCGKVYIRPKALVIKRISDQDLRKAYALCEDIQIIQGIDICMDCDPEGMLLYATPESMEC